MTKAKTTKRALLAAVLALVISVSMLIGTTFAWFTDSVTSASNIIKSGNLDVEMYWADGTKDVPAEGSADWKDASSNAIFDYALWEPGYVSVRHIKIANVGSLALKYMVAIEANGEVSELADVIDVYYVDPAAKVADRTALTADAYLGTLTEVLGKLDSTAAGELEAGKADTITLALKMQESAGNKYKNMEIGTTFSVKVFATQLTAEEDSFGDDYDEGAFLPVVKTVAEFKNAIANGESVKLGADMTITEADAVNGNAIYYTGDEDIVIDLGGYTLNADTNNAGIRIQKAEGGENTITIKNGKIVAGDNAWSAISVGSSAGTKTYVNLENLEIESNKANDMAVRARTGAEFTITDCKITATNGAGGIAAGGGKVTLNNVTVEQYGYYSNNWNCVALGVSGAGSIVVNSGAYTSDPQGEAKGTWVAYVMSSGGNLIINGGTFNGTSGTTANASNARGLICADTKAVVEINGGTFNSTGAILDMRNNTGATPNPTATLKGGTYSADPRVSGLYSSNLIKVADGCTVIDNGNGTWSVVEGIIYDESTMGGLYTYLPTLSSGDVLILPAGTYITTGTFPVPAGVTIKGAEGAEVVIRQNSALQDDIFNCAGDVVFENITFESNRKGYAITYKNQDHVTDGDITVINCKFKGIAADKNYGIYKNLNGNLTVKNCAFDNYTNALCGINNGNGSTTVITGCTFTNVIDEAIGYVISGVPADFEAEVIANNVGLTAENVKGW